MPSTPRSRARCGVPQVDPVPQRRSGAACAGDAGDHRRGAGRAALQGRLAAGRRRRRAPSPTAGGLSFAGVVSVALALDRQGRAGRPIPELDLIGIPETRPRRRPRSTRRSTTRCSTTFESLPRARRRDPDAVAEAVRRAVRAAVAAALGQEADVPRARLDGMMRLPDDARRRRHDRPSQSRRHRGARHRQGGARSTATRWAPKCPRRCRSPSTASPPCSSRCPTPRSSCWSRSARTRRSRSSSSAIPTAASIMSATRSPTSAPRATRSRREGARVLGDGEPKIGAHGKPVLFLHPEGFLRHAGRARTGVNRRWPSPPPSRSISSSGGWCCSRCCRGACAASRRAARSRRAPTGRAGRAACSGSKLVWTTVVAAVVVRRSAAFVYTET